MKHIQYPILLCLYLVTGLSAFGQTPPVDLANLSLGDLLNAKIIRSYSDLSSFEARKQDMPEGYFDSSRLQFSTSYIEVRFVGYMDGTDEVSINDVLWTPGKELRTDENFPVVPTVITQEAIQFKGAYDLTEQWSLSLSIPYIRQETEHVTDNPNFDPYFEDFTIISEGFGDIELGATWLHRLNQNNSILVNLGLSLPTGSIDEVGRTPKDANVDTQLPYTMQLGSGTYDIKPSVVYSGTASEWTYGANLNMTIRTGKNDRDYRLGNVYQAGI